MAPRRGLRLVGLAALLLLPAARPAAAAYRPAPAISQPEDPWLHEWEEPPEAARRRAALALGNWSFRAEGAAGRVWSALRRCIAAIPSAYNNSLSPMDPSVWPPGHPCGFVPSFHQKGGLQSMLGAGTVAVIGDSTSNYLLRRLLLFGKDRTGPMFQKDLKASMRRLAVEKYSFQPLGAPAPAATEWWGLFSTAELTAGLRRAAAPGARLVLANAGLHDFEPLYRLKEGHGSWR
eukprot:TRINITY_DN36550_c0_g1_i2.p3 TRINITY_DN36550_c0_g1~~TRINITY_DN36550_c0_g1_i2.p3  ORF type:complete len:258 (+),score=104.13 TRINITY_DN36550_c0_g1_i2:73-774(+)